MTKLIWDAVGERFYESGVDHGVLYIPNNLGVYETGYAWNGLTAITESPSGAEASPQYADNIKYLNLISAEEFGGTIEAFTYPKEFEQCDGTASPQTGVSIGQQSRKTFGLAYRTKVGNDTDGQDHGYKLHLVYGALASVSEKAHNTINDSPEAVAFSWDFTTTAVYVPGFKPSATVTIDSRYVDSAALADLEEILFGAVGVDPRLPLPAEVFDLFDGTVTEVTPTPPTFNSGTHTITIPAVTGVVYKNDLTNVVLATGAHVIAVDTVVKAYPLTGYTFPAVVDDDWFFDFV